MTILYTINSLDNSGGVERVAANKANWLVNHGHEVAIITSCGFHSFYKLDTRVRVLCLHLESKNNGNSIIGRIYQSLRRSVQHAIRLRKLIKRVRPDVISSIHSDDFYILPFVKGKSKFVFEYHFVSEANTGRDNNIISKLHDRVMSKYDAIVFLTIAETKRYASICNSVHIANSNSFARSTPAQLTSKNVIAVGNLIPVKGFDRLIYIWQKVAKENPQWTLNIFGEGDERGYLQKLIDDLELNNSIKLMGRTKDIHSNYCHSSIFVSTSSFESFSMVVLESQSLGLPCVSFDCPYGPREIIIDNVSGFLIPMDDESLFVKSLLYLMDNDTERQRIGHNAFMNSQRFDLDVIMNKWIDLFSAM